MIFLTDSQLTGFYPNDTSRTFSNAARKVFSLGPFAIGCYCGSRWSARFALARLKVYFERFPTPRGDSPGTDFIRDLLGKGAREAKHATAPWGDGPGPFQVIVGFIDTEGQFVLMTDDDSPPGDTPITSRVWIGEKDETRPPMLVVGSGGTRPMEVVAVAEEALAWVKSSGLSLEAIEGSAVGHQGSYLAGSLQHALDNRSLPYCGGGVQMMTLDYSGTTSWGLWEADRNDVPEMSAGPVPDSFDPAAFPGWKSRRARLLPD